MPEEEIHGDTPRVRLAGTESDSKSLHVREDTGNFILRDETTGVDRAELLMDGTPVEWITILEFGRVHVSDTSATGTSRDTPPSRLLLDDTLFRNVKLAYFEGSADGGYTDGDQYLRIHDDTAGVDVTGAELGGTNYHEERDRTADVLGNLTAGNEIHFYVDITAASTTAQALDASGRLILVSDIAP